MAPIEFIIYSTYCNDSNLPPEDSLQIEDKNRAPKVSFIRRLHCSEILQGGYPRPTTVVTFFFLLVHLQPNKSC